MIGDSPGGYFHMYAYWVCAARETPIFSPEFPFRSISFSQITKKSVPEHHHFTFSGGFCRSGDYHLKIFFNFNPFITPHGRLSPNAKHSAAPRVSGRSGDSHFHAQNGSSSFRSPAFSRSKRLKLVPEPRIFKLKTAQARSGAHFHARPRARSGALAHFSLCRSTYLSKFGVSTPPPPPPPRGDMQTVELGQTSIVLATPLSIICLYLATHLSQTSQNC